MDIKNLSQYINRRWLTTLLTLIALIPLAFNNQNNGQDWGDDNFQYLYQAKHLWNVDHATTVINPENHGPEKKGIFFSFLLSFNLIQTASGYMAIVFLCFLFCGICLQLFYSTCFPPLVASMMAICFAYHPFAVDFKNEILSEFLFTGLLFLILFLVYQNKTPYYLITTLFVFLVLTRELGIYFYLCYLAKLLVSPREKIKKGVSQGLFSLFIFGGFYFLLYKLLYPISLRAPHFYLLAFSGSDLLTNIQQNAGIYLNEALNYFEFECPQGFNDGLKALFIIFILLGITDLLQKKDFLIPALFFGSLIILLCYPDQAGARRFLLPLFPFLVLFIIKGMQWIFGRADKIAQSGFACVLLLLVVFSLEAKTLSVRRPVPGLAANDPSVIRDLEKVRAFTSESSVIGFEKPYVVNYYCERNSFAFIRSSPVVIPETVTHLLFLKNAENESLKKTISADTLIILDNFELLELRQRSHQH